MEKVMVADLRIYEEIIVWLTGVLMYLMMIAGGRCGY